MIETGQLRRWHEETYDARDFNGVFIVLDRLKDDEFLTERGEPGLPAWNVVSGGIADWLYEVDLIEMSEVVNEAR